MFKKTLLFICIFCLCNLTAYAKEKYIFFIEDTSYNDMLKYSNTKDIINNSVKALAIQRKGEGDFSFFQSIKFKKPSSILDAEVPLIDSFSDARFSGNVLKDGTYYVPSIIFLNGQSSDNYIRYVHVKDAEDLDNKLISLKTSDSDILIITWTREKIKKYESYLTPVIYFDRKNKGVFYSKTTRNLGILDYENLNTLILGNGSDSLSIEDGDINKIYQERINNLKNKRVFLTLYGYFLAITSIVNSILSRLALKKIISILSTLAVVSPLAILIEPISKFNDINFITMIILILSLILSFYTFGRKNLTIISLIFLVIIYLDSLTTNYLLRNSLLSYEPALGARFYGIGNEYLGVILAYSFIIIHEMRIKKVWVVWGINAILLLLNNVGNNFGGFITCGVMMFINSSLLAGIILLILGGTIISFSDNHIGRFFREILKGNMNYPYLMFLSKLSTLKKLLSLSIWTKLSIISIAVYLLEFFKGRFKFYGKAYQIVVCCIVVIVTNDSGIVSMALLLGIYINYMFVKHNLEETKWNT